jgi:hypothetical protein
MDETRGDELKLWGVRCSDGEILWVADEQAAHRVLTSLVGADRIVRRADPRSAPISTSPGPETPSG